MSEPVPKDPVCAWCNDDGESCPECGGKELVERFANACRLLSIARAAMTCRTANAPNPRSGFEDVHREIGEFLEAEGANQ